MPATLPAPRRSSRACAAGQWKRNPDERDAHHLTDVFAVVGLSGAAIFLNAYKTPLLWLGIVMNLFGIAYLLWNIRQQRKSVVNLHYPTRRASGEGG